jgi:hypothetical protein
MKRIWRIARRVIGWVAVVAVVACERRPTTVTATANAQTGIVSVCIVADKEKTLAGQELLVRGHYFRGKEGAMVYDDSCKAYLRVWGEFDYPSGTDSKDWFVFHGRIEKKSGLGIDGRHTGYVLVVDKVSSPS